MGSGETLTALWVAKDYLQRKIVNRVHIVAPNVSVPEFRSSFAMAGITSTVAKKIKLLTHDKFAAMKRSATVKNSFVIIDEAHLFTEKKYDALESFNVDYLLLLTGTPAPYEPFEVVPLLNLLYREKKNRWQRKRWDSAGEKKQQEFMTNKVSVFNIGEKHNYMSYIDDKQKRCAGANYPEFKVRSVKVPQIEQEIRYNKVLKKMRGKKSRQKYPFYTQERKIINQYAAGVESSLGIKATPKKVKVAQDVVGAMQKNASKGQRLKGGRILVYVHNYDVLGRLKNAINVLCEHKKIAPAVAEYNGSTSESMRRKVKDAFNRGDIDVLIISSAGSVGLDLKCTSKAFLDDVCWNIPTMNQIIGRAIRTNSHDEVKTGCKHNFVDVSVYISVFSNPRGKRQVFDNIILTLAEQKWADVSTMITKVMNKASI